MLVLGVETSTPLVGVSVGNSDGLISSFHLIRERRHAETLAPAIDFVCRQAGIEINDLDVVAVDIGPGLFTGLRVGLTTAKALAYALRVPMIGVLSLDLVAYPARYFNNLILSTIDARRGELYYACYRQCSDGVQRITEPQVGPPAEVVDHLNALDDDCLVVGDGAQRYSQLFREATRVEVAGEGFRYPTAESLLQIATARALRHEVVPESKVQPFYLRAPDVQLSRQP